MEKVTVNKESGTVTIDGVPYKIGEVVKQKPTPEERFLELVKGAVRKHDFEKYPDSIFWFKDNKVIIEERKNGRVWIDYNKIWKVFIDYDKIWKVFYHEYDYDHEQLSDLCKKVLEKHFNLRGCTPFFMYTFDCRRWRNISI